jgi:hypothetical protein
MEALRNLIERRDRAEETAEAAEAHARALALKDPEGAAAALRKAHDAALDAEVAAMAADERARLDAEEAERDLVARRAAAERELRDVLTQQHEAATRFDAAAQDLERAFDELEELARRADALRDGAGLPTTRDFAGRTIGLTRALWHGCPGVAKRLRLAFAPGRGRAPLADAYRKED